MTVEELRSHINSINIPLLEKLVVDHETYANVCDAIFKHESTQTTGRSVIIAIGKNKGIMFKGIELLLKKT
jgi:hypothetical protein